MAKLTLDDLKKLREQKQKEMTARTNEGKDTQIIVGMGTCGIAAGAKAAFTAFIDEIEKHALANVIVRQTGCMGLCYSEPTVEVSVPGMPTVVYGKVTDEVARRIVRKHIVGKVLINDHIFDKPAADLTQTRKV